MLQRMYPHIKYYMYHDHILFIQEDLSFDKYLHL